MSVATAEYRAVPLGELAAAANQAHFRAVNSGSAMVAHAICAGQALLEAQAVVPHGEWLAWLHDNVRFVECTAYVYMRLARFQTHLAPDVSSIGEALRQLKADRATAYFNSGPRIAPEVRAEARALAATGATDREIARAMGVSPSTVFRWLNPEAARRYDKAKSDKRGRLRAEKAERVAREEAHRSKAAARKKGGAAAELYAMSERMQDVLAQAHRESTDSTARKHYAKAGEHYRQMRDQIVKAVLA